MDLYAAVLSFKGFGEEEALFVEFFWANDLKHAWAQAENAGGGSVKVVAWVPREYTHTDRR